MLPVIKETDEQIAERLPIAFERIFDIVPSDDRPGIYRRYVFDSEDGFRFIVSRNRIHVDVATILGITDREATVVHVSVSGHDDISTSYKFMTIPNLVNFMQAKWLLFGGRKLFPIYVGNGVFHFFDGEMFDGEIIVQKMRKTIYKVLSATM